MKRNFILSTVFAFFSVLLIVLIKLVDVAELGPLGSKIGLSSLNGAVKKALGESALFDKLTDALMLLAIAAVAVFALLGVIQLIRRKSLWKIDAEILCLGGAMVILAALYAFFEVVVVNYRPVLDEGKLAASFPSSHTLLSVTVFLCLIFILGSYIKKPSLLLASKIAAGALGGISVIGRLLSGVHWFTDILGGVLVSLAVVFLFAATLSLLKAKGKTE